MTTFALPQGDTEPMPSYTQHRKGWKGVPSSVGHTKISGHHQGVRVEQ